MEAAVIAPPQQLSVPLLDHRLRHRRAPSPLILFSTRPSQVTFQTAATPTAAAVRSLKCCATYTPSLPSSAPPLAATATPSLATTPSLAKFKEASVDGNLIPLYRCISSDHLTAELAYRSLNKDGQRDTPSFLFESVEPSGLSGRYSAVGVQPTMEVIAKQNSLTLVDHFEGQTKEEFVEDPMEVPRRIMEEWKPQCIDHLPEAFCGGWVGYFSYDTVRYVEKGKVPFSNAPADDRDLPDVHLGLYDDVVVFDRFVEKVYIIHWVLLDRFASVEEAYEDGTNRLESLFSRVSNSDVVAINGRGLDSPPISSLRAPRLFHQPSLGTSNMNRQDYKDAVLRAKEHIFAGDIFQIVLSQRFEMRTFADPFEVYLSLKTINPSPYMAYLQARGCVLVASSPEILTRVIKGKITNRPLAGTIRRGKTSKEDIELGKQLLNDEKQLAEHTMLVDLARNDVGKVSKPGSVKIEKLMDIEKYSHVMHISSTVTGELPDHLTSWDALRAALPVGTVSGAPKVKAMELIDKLEVTKRGPYGGGFGWISFSGDIDVALALRTMVFSSPAPASHSSSHKNTKYRRYKYDRRQWVAHLQAGAGIVADSDPDDEQRECENKAVALACAVHSVDQSSVLVPHQGGLQLL